MRIAIPAKLAGAKQFSITNLGTNHEVVIPDSCHVGNFSVYMQGNNCRLIVGENCHLVGTVKIRGNNSSIFIGDGTTMGRAILMALEDDQEITLGRDCMLSHGIYLNTSDSHSIIDTISGRRINRPGSIIVGDHVWLGAEAFVTKGTTIGDGAIVAARAVVTKDVPARTVVGGNPARVLRQDVTWDRALLPFDDHHVSSTAL